MKDYDRDYDLDFSTRSINAKIIYSKYILFTHVRIFFRFVALLKAKSTVYTRKFYSKNYYTIFVNEDTLIL